MRNSGERFNYPIAFSRAVFCALKTPTDNSYSNNMLIGEAALARPQWGMRNSGERFNYPIAFSRAVFCALKTPTDNSYSNNMLIGEAALARPELTYVDLPNTKPGFKSFILVIGV